MKTLILSTAMVMGLGAAAPAMAQGVYIGTPGGGYDRGGDCRMVEKRVERGNKTVITKERRCDGDRRVYREDRRDRYVERRDSGPGLYIGR